MKRRIPALLVTWFFLLGVAGSAIACADFMAGEDCCPAGSTSLCECAMPAGNGETDPDTCLAPVPSTIADVAAHGLRPQPSSALDPGSAELVAVFAWPTSVPARTQSLPRMSSTPLQADRQASLTYLLTGRLRL